MDIEDKLAEIEEVDADLLRFQDMYNPMKMYHQCMQLVKKTYSDEKTIRELLKYYEINVYNELTKIIKLNYNKS